MGVWRFEVRRRGAALGRGVEREGFRLGVRSSVSSRFRLLFRRLGLGAGGEDFVGGFAVHNMVIDAAHGALGHHLGALGVGGGAEAAGGRTDQGAGHHRRRALFVQHRDQGLANAQRLDGLGGVEGGIGAEAEPDAAFSPFCSAGV